MCETRTCIGIIERNAIRDERDGPPRRLYSAAAGERRRKKGRNDRRNRLSLDPKQAHAVTKDGQS